MENERSAPLCASVDMKKIFSLVLLISLVLPAFLSTETVFASHLSDESVSTFADLGLAEDIVLNGPYDAGTLSFDIPPTKKLTSGVVLELEITSHFVGVGESTQLGGNSLIGASLEVYFNDKLQQSIPLLDGNRVVYRVPISDDALISTMNTGEHRISFFLDAAIDCDLDFHKTTVVIGTNSKAFLQYDQIPLSLDLRRLPWPIYQERRKLADPVTLVVPDAPSVEELRSALIVMGSFARMTGGKLPVTMITISQLTDEIKLQSHLLLVGKASTLPVLNELSLPVPLDAAGFFSQEGTEEDGVIQAIPSPWNEERVLLLVSGASDQAVVKSAQALSTLNLQTGVTPNYSIVAQVNPVSSLGVLASDLTQFNSPDVTFADLGFVSADVSGLGTNWQSYEFVIPAGQVPSEAPYLNLNYSVSELVDPLRSEGVVYLNDVRIGSIPLTTDTSNLITTKIKLPASSLRGGTNNLDIVLHLVPKDNCSAFSFTGLWVTIFSDSVLHLPLTRATDTAFVLEDLRAYPSPFSNDPSLSSVTIVIPQQDFASWLQAGKLVYDLSIRIPSPVLAFNVAFDGQLKEELRTSNFILLGRPKELSILAETRNAMPAHFEADSNIAVLDSQQVVYRISEQKDLGYLELFSSPWNSEAVILGVFGTSTNGVEYAVNALLTPEIRDKLSGNFAALDGSNSTIIDTRTGLGLGRIISNPNLPVESVATVVPTQSVANVVFAVNQSRKLIFFAMVGIIVVMGAVILIAVRARKRSL